MSRDEFEALWNELSPPIYYKLMKQDNEAADDIMHNVAVAILRKLDEVEYINKAKFYTFLSVTAQYERLKYYRDVYKRQSYITVTSDDELTYMNQTQESTIQLSDQIEANIIIHEIYQHLKEREKLLFELRILKDLPFSQVASAMGISEDAAMMAFSRLRKKIKGIVKKI